MKNVPHVALLIETSNAYCRNLLEGITAYIRDNRPWSIYLAEHERGAPVPKWLHRWNGDGIIARIENETIAQAIAEAEVPVINVSSANYDSAKYAVTVDEKKMAQMAFEHLRERGFQQYAFCGTAGPFWSIMRERNFAALVQEVGFPCHVFPTPKRKRSSWEDEQTKVAQWVRSLPKPIGLLASHDFRGQQVLDACRRVAVSVPEQVAVISYGNDELLCNLTSPPMTSLTFNSQRAGYKAASMLDRLMDGKTVEPRIVMEPPTGVCTRQSTDIVAINNPDIVTALQMIRKSACEGLQIADILNAIPLSRRVFETLFKKLVGRTAHQEILRVKLGHAKRLLAESELSLTQVAHRAGFTHTSYMNEVFRKKVGLSPSKYRKEFGGK